MTPIVRLSLCLMAFSSLAPACQTQDDGPEVTGACPIASSLHLYAAHASVSASNQGTCSDLARSAFDGPATVDSVENESLRLSFEQGCVFTLQSPPTLGLTVGDSLWLVWRQGLGQPFSGEQHERFALRTSQDGTLLVASQVGGDRPPADALADALDLGMSLATVDGAACTDSLGDVGCYANVRSTSHAIVVQADESTTSPVGEAVEITIGGQSYEFVGVAMTYTADYRNGCMDGPTLSGWVGWDLTLKP